MKSGTLTPEMSSAIRGNNCPLGYCIPFTIMGYEDVSTKW